MRVVIATDKFKGSLTSVQAAAAMAEGVRSAAPATDILECPMADGGEGTVEAVAASSGASIREKEVAGPLPSQTVLARWALLDSEQYDVLAEGEPIREFVSGGRRAAVIEMAQASGFSLVPEEKMDPTVTTTLGTGQLIMEAIESGCDRVVVGIGGSATVDGGTGMARALGYRFLDEEGRELAPCGGSLKRIHSIDVSGADPRIEKTGFLIASDVNNPLVGEQGAARVYGPQKGASPDQVEMLERGLERLSRLMESDFGVEPGALPGAGAAGGLGAALMAFCGARIASGVDLVASIIGLRSKVRDCDLVLTGEGRFDGQTVRGKTPIGVARMAREEGVTAVIVAGDVSAGIDWSPPPGVAVYSICPGPMGLEEAIAGASGLLSAGAERLMRLLLLLPDRPGARN